jgi:hypothetical protein
MRLILALLLFCQTAHATEVITGLDEVMDLPVLNEELRKMDEATESVAERVEALEDSPFTPTTSNALAGSVVQVVNTQTGAVSSGAVTTPAVDDSIPENTEGIELMTLAITPTSATNKLKITVVANISNDTQVQQTVFLCQDSTVNALAVSSIDLGNTSNPGVCTFVHYMTAGTTSSTTFKVRAGSGGGTITFNGFGGNRKFGGAFASSITIEEIKV